MSFVLSFLLLFGGFFHHGVQRKTSSAVTIGPILNPNSALTTNTLQWACIRFNESTDGELSSNIYQIQGYKTLKQLGIAVNPAALSREEQNSLALELYNESLKIWHSPWHPWLADKNVCHL